MLHVGLSRRFAIAAVLAAVVLTMVQLIFVCPAHAASDEPQHGIPLVIVYVDESDSAIAAANAADAKHTYGTIADMNNSEDHSVRCVGDVRIIVPDGFVSDYGSSAVPSGNMPLKYIRGRGNSTWASGGADGKKPYKIEFKDVYDLFGMGACTDWALMANSYDSTLVQNRATYWLGTQMGLPYTPQLVPVDVVMVGLKDGNEVSRQSLGSYYLSETVMVDPSRLAIAKLKKGTTAEDPAADPNITGGYLLSYYTDAQNSDEPASTVFSTPSGIELINKTPEFESEDLSEGQAKQRAYIRSYVNELDRLIMESDEIDEETHKLIASKLDLRSVADYWWLQEFSTNGDAFGTSSTYLYKDRNGKLCFGPLWDFDLAWGHADEVGSDNVPAGFNNTSMGWVDKLRDADPLFVELLKERWSDPETGLDKQLDELTRSGGVMDSYVAETEQSWNANAALWPDSTSDPESGASLAHEAKTLCNWIDSRRAWVNDHIDELDTVYFRVAFVVDGEEIYSERMKAYGQVNGTPDPPKREGYVCVSWTEQETGETPDQARVTRDLTFVAQYKTIDEVEFPEQLYVLYPEQWAILGDTYYLPWLLPIPEDAYIGDVTWTTSDESVVKILPDEVIEYAGVGDATLTATLANGMSTSYVIHVYDPNVTEAVQPTGITAQGPMTLKVGESKRISYAIAPSGTPLSSHEVSYLLADDGVVKMDETGVGVLTGLTPGTTEVTVYCMLDGVEEALTTTLTVNVVEAPKSFAITYKLGGGSYDGNTEDIVEMCEEGSEITIREAPTREGYTFLYWEGSKHYPGDAYTVTGDHTFTAVWADNSEGTDYEDGEDTGGSDASQGTASKTRAKGAAGRRSSRTGDSLSPLPIAAVLVVAAGVFIAAGVLRRRRD